MKLTLWWQRTAATWLAGCVLALTMSGCTTVKLVSDYDEKIDTGVTQLHKDTSAYMAKIKTVDGANVEAYDKAKFYPETKLAVASLRLRADATQRNNLTVQILDKLQVAFDQFEVIHSGGLTKVEMPPLELGFNSAFLAILTFEIAKKRGESVDITKATEKATPKTGATK